MVFVSTVTGKNKIILVFASRFSEVIFEGDHDIKKWEDVNLMQRIGGGGGVGVCVIKIHVDKYFQLSKHSVQMMKISSILLSYACCQARALL